MISATELITVIKETITYVITMLSKSEGFEDMRKEDSKPELELITQKEELDSDEQMEDTDRQYSLRSRKTVNYKV